MRVRNLLDWQVYPVLPSLAEGDRSAAGGEQVEFACPQCRRVIRCHWLLGGQRGRCQRCGAIISVPFRTFDKSTRASGLPPFMQIHLVRPVETGFQFGIGAVLGAGILCPVIVAASAVIFGLIQWLF